MKQRTKWFFSLFATLALVASPLVFGHGLSAKADDNPGSQGQDELRQEADQIDQSEHEEGDVHGIIQTEQNKQITVPDVNEDRIVTYGDAIALLQSFQAVLSQTHDATSTLSQVSGLSPAEQDLLNQLLGQQKNYFASLSARAAELNSQIQNLITVLSPLSSQPVSESAGIRTLLISELKGFKEQIGKLGDLEDLDLEIVDNETM